MNRICWFLAFCFLGGWVQSQELAPPDEPEAPEALFDQKIGDVGVVLEAEGTWTTRMAAGWGQGYSALGTLPALGYPGYEKGGVFSQQPDFSLTLRLMERYYLEVLYSGSLEDRTFLVGYQGQPDELLQWVKAGNSSFSVPPRAGQNLADGRRGAPAAAASLQAGPVALEFLGRYEDGSRETKTFRGFRDTAASLVPLDQWIRGRFFQLPASEAPFLGVRVKIADPAGALASDGVRYREAAASEVSVSAESGTLQLPAPAERRYLMTWNGANTWSNPASVPLGLSAGSLTLEGLTWWVLIQPGTPSPFEQRHRYPVARGTTDPIVLVVRDTGVPVTGFTVGQSAGQDWFEVSGSPEAPFYDQLPGLYPADPGTGEPPPAAATLPWVFRLPAPAAASFALGPDVQPSSLVVVRNGLPTADYQFDGGTGTLRLAATVYDTDLIEVSFQRIQPGVKASDLVLWQGGRWAAAEGHEVEWALQGRWNMEQGRYTTEDLQSPGRMAASVSYQGSAGDWTWKGSVTGGALLADSTGRRRLLGLATDGTQATLDGNALRPSAVPFSLNSPPWSVTPSLSETNRAPLVYRNYWTNDPLTGTPQVSAWGKAGINPEPDVEGGWIGPYLVRGDGVRTDRLAVAEATLASGQWAAFQVFLDQGAPRDLKSATAVTVNVRLPSALGSSGLYLQAGTLSEDWDGRGTVRKVEYRSVPALPFEDSTRGLRYFPIPEGSSWGNDTGDGSAGTDGALVTRNLTTLAGFSTTSGDWQEVRFVLTDAERQLLQRTTGWRLVLVQGTGSATHTVLLGPVVFEGASWTVVSDPNVTTGTVNPVEQPDPADQSRQQLRVDWSGRAAWSLESRFSSVRPASYRTVGFRYRLTAESTGSAPITLALTDAQGRGLRVQWTPTVSSAWIQGKIDLKEKTLRLDGVPAAASVSVDAVSDPWGRILFAKGGSSSSGTVILSEVEALDPLWEPLASTSLTAGWKQPAPWPAFWPILSGFAWTGTSNQSGLTSDSLILRGQSTLSGSVGPLRASGEVRYQKTARDQEGHGSYETTLPLGWAEGPRLEWTEKFSDAGLRSEKVLLGLPWVGTWEAQGSAKGPPLSLDQDYSLGWKAPDQVPGWGAALTARWSQSTPQSLPLSSFAQTWTDSWSWLVPRPETAPFYLLQAQGEARAAFGPFSFELDVQNRVSQSSSSQKKWTAWGDWEGKLPYRNTAGGWSLTPSVSKSVEAVYAGAENWPPQDSALLAAERLWMPPGALGSLPFGEQDLSQTPWLAESKLQSGKVESTVGLDWERQAVSDWTDLVVPAAAGVKGSTRRGREGEAAYRAGSVAATLQTKGINLFGALGSLPVFPWYRTDVWSWSTAAAWGTGTRTADQVSETSVALRVDVVLTPEESLGLPVSYQGKGGVSPSHSVRTGPTWTLRHPADLPFELPRWLSPSAFRRQWAQDLGVTLDLGWQPTPSPVVRDLQVSWKGRLLLSEKSELSLTTKWGQQWQESLTIVGLEAAIELVLSF